MFALPSAVYERSIAQDTGPPLWSPVLYVSHFGGWVLVSHCDFHLFPPKNNGAEHLSLHFSAIWLSSFVKCISNLYIFTGCQPFVRYLYCKKKSSKNLLPACSLPLHSFRAHVAQWNLFEIKNYSIRRSESRVWQAAFTWLHSQITFQKVNNIYNSAPQKVPMCPPHHQYPLCKSKLYPDLYHHRFVLPVLDLHINWIIQSILFFIWLLLFCLWDSSTFCVAIICSFSSLYDIPLYKQTAIWVVSRLVLLWKFI